MAKVLIYAIVQKSSNITATRNERQIKVITSETMCDHPADTSRYPAGKPYMVICAQYVWLLPGSGKYGDLSGNYLCTSSLQILNTE